MSALSRHPYGDHYHCLEVGGEHAAPGYSDLMLDCAAISRANANFMLRRSDRHVQIYGSRTNVCEHRAEDDATVRRSLPQPCQRLP